MTTQTFGQKLERLVGFYELTYPGTYQKYELVAPVNHPVFGFTKTERSTVEGLISMVFIDNGGQRTLSADPVVTILREVSSQY